MRTRGTNIKELNAYQTLTCWLENQSASTSAKPDGLSNGSSSGAWKETCRQASGIVEDVPLYSMVRLRLIDWVTQNFPRGDGFELCRCFCGELEDRLLLKPFFEVRAVEIEESARMPVQSLSIDVVALELGIKRNALWNRLDALKTTLPYGSYRDDKRKWQIHPLDVQGIKAMFEKNEEVEKSA